jgi:hypothetical protein
MKRYTLNYYTEDTHQERFLKGVILEEETKELYYFSSDKTGSKWTKSENDTVYYHVVQKGESLEYIFNDIQLSLQKAKEQNFNILKKDDERMEVIPVYKYKDELNNGTYFYSGLNPKDTVYLSKLELESFKIEKGLN